jgi:hypothetical protein
LPCRSQRRWLTRKLSFRGSVASEESCCRSAKVGVHWRR